MTITPTHFPSAMVKQGATCLGCSYDLGGLNNSGACPECGKPIIQSLRGNYLQYADPEWFETLIRGSRMTARGFWIAIAGLMSVALLMIISLVSSVALTLSPKGFNELALAILTAVAVVTIPLASIWSCVGWFILTAPEPQRSQQLSDGPRRASRYSLIAWILFAVVTVSLYLIALQHPLLMPSNSLMMVFAIHTFISSCFFWSSMTYIRDLANRLPSLPLFRHARGWRWMLLALTSVGVLFLGMGPIVALAFFIATVHDLSVVLQRLRQRLPLPTNSSPS